MSNGYVLYEGTSLIDGAPIVVIGTMKTNNAKAGEKPLKREIECLSDSRGMTCEQCMVCDGGDKGKSIYITVHGAKASKFNPDLIAIG